MRNAFRIYLERVSVHTNNRARKKYRIGRFCCHSIADIFIQSITSVRIAQFLDQRLSQINPHMQRPMRRQSFGLA